MRDFVHLAVIIPVFVVAATLATVMAMPALEWASGEPDWKIMVSVLWLLACYLLCAFAAMRFLAWYRHHVDR